MIEKSKEAILADVNLTNGQSRAIAQVETETNILSPKLLELYKELDPELYEILKNGTKEHIEIKQAKTRYINAQASEIEADAYKTKHKADEEKTTNSGMLIMAFIALGYLIFSTYLVYNLVKDDVPLVQALLPLYVPIIAIIFNFLGKFRKR